MAYSSERKATMLKRMPPPNNQPLRQLSREEGISEAINVLTTVTDLSLPEFVGSCRAGPDAIQKTYPLPLAQARRLSEASEEILMLIEELELLPTTTISCARSGPVELQGITPVKI